MFDVIIPARSGSTGIKNKNIKKFGKDILLNHLIKKIINIKKINKIFILTDSKSYKKKIIKNQKIVSDYIRPKNLSKSNSKIFDLIRSFIKWCDKKKLKLNKIIIFQATSPLLCKKEINKTISFIEKNKLKSLYHVTEMLEHPHECIKGYKNNWSFLKKKETINRQNYGKYYFITGSFYFFTKKFFFENKKFYNNKSYAFKVDKINFVDIDTKFDFEMAKKLSNLKIRN